MNREAVVEGRPEFVLSGEEREALVELLADVLLETLAATAPAATAPAGASR